MALNTISTLLRLDTGFSRITTAHHRRDFLFGGIADKIKVQQSFMSIHTYFALHPHYFRIGAKLISDDIDLNFPFVTFIEHRDALCTITVNKSDNAYQIGGQCFVTMSHYILDRANITSSLHNIEK